MSTQRNTPESQQTLDAALRWIERLRDNNLQEKEIFEWLSWYEASEEHRRVFDELQDFARSNRAVAGTPEGRQFIEQMAGHSLWHRLWWRVESWFAARLIEREDSRHPWRLLAAYGAGLAAVVVAVLVTVSLYVSVGNRSDLRAGTASSRLVSDMTLSDDSKVELAPSTTVTVAYAPAERRLEMGPGVANFTVAPNKERPFIVHVDKLWVRAVGTQFNIHRSGGRVAVTVIEGKVDIYRDSAEGSALAPQNTHLVPAGPATRVAAGQEYKTTEAAGEGTLSAVNAQEALTWRDGRLSYVNEPLAVVIADINRYVARPIVIRDKKLESLSYTGTVFTDLIDEWLNAMPKEFPLVLVTESNQTLLISRTADYNKTN